MHIGFVCEEYPPAPHGGIGSVVRDLAESLAAAGERVTVMGVSKSHPPVASSEIVRGVRVVRLPPAPPWAPARLHSWWERRSVFTQLRNLHRENAFDILECPDYAGWLPRGGPPGVPVVVRLHGSNLFYDAELQRPPHPRLHALELQCLRRASFLVAVSRYAGKRTLEIAGLGNRACTVIHNAVDAAALSPGEPSSVERGLIVFVNSIRRRKGVEELIEAANAILPRRPEARLVLIGGALSAEYLEMLKAKVNPAIRERVTFLGRIPRQDAVPWLRRAAVCCYPSHMETFGLAPLEAMSAGRPVIFSSRGPGPEILEDGVSGLLCDPADPDSIAKCLVTLLDDPAKAEEMGRAARNRVLNQFEMEGWLRRNLEFYRQCLQ